MDISPPKKALNTDLSVFTSFLPMPISIVSVCMNCEQHTTKTITLLSSRSKSSCGHTNVAGTFSVPSEVQIFLVEPKCI